MRFVVVIKTTPQAEVSSREEALAWVRRIPRDARNLIQVEVRGGHRRARRGQGPRCPGIDHAAQQRHRDRRRVLLGGKPARRTPVRPPLPVTTGARTTRVGLTDPYLGVERWHPGGVLPMTFDL